MKSRRKKRKNILNIVKIIIISLLVFLIAIYIGLKILVNILFFASKLLPEKTVPQSPKPNSVELSELPDITVLSIPEATNSSRIKASLFVENAEKIKVYLNDSLVKSLSLTEENVEITFGELKEGENIVYFVAQYKEKSQKSPEYTITLDTTPPKLEILSPEDNSSTTDAQIEIKGKTENKVLVKINSSPVIVSQNGEFVASVPLKEGENKIKITAKDEAGNITTKELTIVKTNP